MLDKIVPKLLPTPTYDVASDPLLQWVTLGIAGLAIAGTIYTGFQQHKLTSDLWLRSQRKDAYAKYQDIQMRLGNALMRTNSADTEEARKKAHEPYTDAMNELGPVLGSIKILGSPEVVAACSEQELMNLTCHESLHKPSFYPTFKKFNLSQDATSTYMANDMQQKSVRRRRRETSASRQVIERMTEIRKGAAQNENQ